MKAELVSYTLETIPPLTEKDKAALKALGQRPDDEIDTSDSPEITEEQWSRGERYTFKKQGNAG